MKQSKCPKIKIMLAIVFVIIIISIYMSMLVFASETYDFANFTEEDSMSFVKDSNIEIPQNLLQSDDLSYFTHTIVLESYKNPNRSFYFNYYETQRYAESIRLAVKSSMNNQKDTISTYNSSYSLRDSKVLNTNGEWVTEDGYYDARWSYYNCYAYSLNRREFSYFYDSDFRYQPGDMTPGEADFASISTIYDLALLVETDLIAMGYANISISYEIPTITEKQELICVRMCLGVDYHFMRYDIQSDSWYHKPGATAVLKYNYVPSNDRLWNNEANVGIIEYNPTVYYDSDIIFITYDKNQINLDGDNTTNNIYIKKSNDVFFELNILEDGHYSLEWLSNHNFKYEIYNENFYEVVWGRGDNLEKCIVFEAGKYYLRINFEDDFVEDSVDVLFSAIIDTYICIDLNEHIEMCSKCNYEMQTYHCFEYSNITNYQHTKTCSGCGLTEIELHNLAVEKIDNTYHQSYCLDCKQRVLVETHTYTYSSTSNGRSHSKTCRCGISTTEMCVGRASIEGTSYCVH